MKEKLNFKRENHSSDESIIWLKYVDYGEYFAITKKKSIPHFF